MTNKSQLNFILNKKQNEIKSMNLLNDMNYYKVALCDFQYIFKNK